MKQTLTDNIGEFMCRLGRQMSLKMGAVTNHVLYLSVTVILHAYTGLQEVFAEQDLKDRVTEDSKMSSLTAVFAYKYSI